MNKFLFIAVVSLFCWHNANAQWNYLGMKNIKVNALEIQDNYIYAATDSGLFKKNILLADTIWDPVGFLDQQVNAIYLLDSINMYVGVQISGIGSDTISLLVTNNGGTIWNSLWGAYDPSELSYVQVTDIEGISSNSDTLIIISGGIRKSSNGGISFTKVNNLGGRFLTVAANNSNKMWTGSEGVFLNPYLIQSIDAGNSWFNNDSLQQIVTGDNACLSGDIHPTNSDIVYIGMEGQMGKSTDNGSNWEIIFTSAYYTKAVKISPTNSSTVYATGGKFGGLDLVLFISKDDGISWDTLKNNLGTLANTVDPLELAVKAQLGVDLIFIGTRENGVFTFSNCTTANVEVKSADNIEVILCPNPFSAYTNLKFSNPKKENYTLELFNTHGQVVSTLQNITDDEVRIDRGSLSNGVYFFQLRANGLLRASGKMIIE